jgi:hypothetical protein
MNMPINMSTDMPISILDRIERLQSEMEKLPQAHIPTEHTFAPGMYIRTIAIPAGVILVGKIHKTEHIFMLTKGELTVVTEDGEERLKAPCQVICRPGLKRAGYAHTDCVCSNVHITEETDLEKLESMLICSEKTLIDFEEQLCLG